MSDLRLLAIDTSTEACSAALLWSDGEMRLRYTVTERGHADLILPMVDELLAEAGCALGDLDGLAFGRGPGGFTGLRIAAGVVQGLAFGAGLQVAPVSSLAAVAWQVGAGEGILVVNDARMNEFYWACYRFDPAAPCTPELLTPECVGPAASIAPAAAVRHCAGNGLERDVALRDRLVAAGLAVHPGLYPRADAVARLGQQVFRSGGAVPPAAAVPVYIRDDVVKVPAAVVTGMS
jgi:tRNA threonylcarbamoyladenosine biosynthesis protein TsaB